MSIALVGVVIVAGLIYAAYKYRAKLKADVAVAEKSAATTIESKIAVVKSAIKYEINKVVADAKAEAAKVPADAKSVVAKLEADLKKIL